MVSGKEVAVIEGQRPIGREHILLEVPVPLRGNDWRDEGIAICLDNRLGSGIDSLGNSVENISLSSQCGHDLRTCIEHPVILVSYRHQADLAERLRDGTGQDDLTCTPVPEGRFSG